MPQQSTTLNTDQGNKPTSGYYEDSGDGTSKWLMFQKVANGGNVGLGATTDAAATGDGSLIAIVKRLRTLLSGGLPAALSAGGGVKVGVVDAIPAGTNNIGDVDVLTVPSLVAGAAAIGSVLARKAQVVVIATAARTVDGQGSDVDLSTYIRGHFVIDVTAISASTLDFYWQVKDTVLTKYGRARDSAAAEIKINGSTVISATGTYIYEWNRPVGSTGRLDYDFVTGASATFSVNFIGES